MSKINQEELKSLSEAFNLYDTQHNGAIDLQQFTKIVKSLGIVHLSENAIQKTIQANDKNGDGKIDFDEFVNIMSDILLPTPRSGSQHELEELRLCFEKFDKNSDGKISEQELKEVMTGLGEKLSEKEIKEMMTEADTNKDGYIDFEEFRQLIPSINK
ncbi:calmodulin-like protein [Sporodiniella umbellata]|nr:calmodulin-like protein [Sporodiniella umbellata]